VSGAPAGTTITLLNNGWYRVSVPFTPTNTTPPVYSLYNGTTNSYTGDGTSGLFLWGAQTEAGAFPTSYIPTTTTALTRAADVASVNTLSPWYNATEGTLYSEAVPIGLKNPGAQYEVTLGTSGTNEVRNRFVNANAAAQIHSSAGETFSYTTAATVNTVYKTALAYKTNDSAAAINGTASATDTSVTLPTASSVMYLGQDTGGGGLLNGYLRRIVFYPRRLSNAELQSITS
jgi:hypothetical protein